MPPAVTKAVEKVKTTVKDFTLAQKTLVIIGVAVLILGGVVLYSWASQPEYKILFNGLSDKDQAAITEQLDAKAISYKLGDQQISVPADKVYEARMALAEQNLPVGNTTGYAVLDNLGVAASDFQQQMAKKRALEGVLANTIQTLNGVESANVSLAIPEQTVFADPAEKSPTKASVTIVPKGNKTLEVKEVEAIIKMVSSSIPNLEPHNVTVVDSLGQNLSDKVSGSSAAASEMDKRLEEQIRKVVEPLVGAGNVRISVSSTLSDNTRETVKTVYTDPEGGIKPLAESKQDEKYDGTGAPVGGILGPDNIGNPDNLLGQRNSQYSTAQQVVNNGVNSEVTRITQGPGAVERRSVAVVVNATTARRIDMTALRDTVVNAAGVNEAAGDTVNVSRAPFDETAAKAAAEAEAAAKAAAEAERLANMIRQAVIAGLIILLLIIIAAVARRRAKKREREALDLGELDQIPEPYTLAPPEEELLALEAPEPEEEEEEEEEEEPVIDPVMLKVEAKRQEIADMALDKPAMVAEQLRSWMAGR